MQVFKFGGASLKDADGVRNVAKIIGQYRPAQLVVVVSAMGKTTNLLETLADAISQHNKANFDSILHEFYQSHQAIIAALFNDDFPTALADLEKIRKYLQSLFAQHKELDADIIYDQTVAVGELISSKILSAYLHEQHIEHKWLDATALIGTDSSFKEAKVNFEITSENIKNQMDFKSHSLFLTQGFIGSEHSNYITTLGREGSDYSAAIFAYCLNAEKVVIWKDVPGFLNADPHYFKNTQLLKRISYKEAIELAFYGAKVIHPNTLKPLQNKQIPLQVKSFLQPEAEGSTISAIDDFDRQVPSYIFKPNQVLLSISALDYSFILEEDLSNIFAIIAQHKGKISTMQNSALNFSCCVAIPESRLEKLVKALSADFSVKYNTNLELLTIRHYNEAIIKQLVNGRAILLEQKTRNTVRLLMRGQTV